MSLILDKINYVYSEGTAYQIQALKDVNLEIRDGQFIGVIGHTGSGKSTLIQHLNGLVKATSGTIYFNGQDIYDEDFDLRAGGIALRRKGIMSQATALGAGMCQGTFF